MSIEDIAPALLTAAPGRRARASARYDAVKDTKRPIATVWHGAIAAFRRFASHPDPLAEASNWVALIIGTHLPFWPLYVWWSAGSQAFPSSLFTATLAPVFLLIPLLARRNGMFGRVAMILSGVANTALTIWVLGNATGTELFFGPCAALAAILFRRSERRFMILFTMLPLAVWSILQHHAPLPLHRYDAAAAHNIYILNAISVSVLICAFGWLQADIYRRMEGTVAARTRQSVAGEA